MYTRIQTKCVESPQCWLAEATFVCLFLSLCGFVALSLSFYSFWLNCERVACDGIYLLFCYLHIPSPLQCSNIGENDSDSDEFHIFFVVSPRLWCCVFFDVSFCALRVFLFVLSASSCLTIMLSILVALFFCFCCHSFSHFVFIGNRFVSFAFVSFTYICTLHSERQNLMNQLAGNSLLPL